MVEKVIWSLKDELTWMKFIYLFLNIPKNMQINGFKDYSVKSNF